MGWTISEDNDSSSNIFGIQLDPDDTGEKINVECYWDGDEFGDDNGRASILSFEKLKPEAWYRVRAKFTKLTEISVRIDVRVVELDAEGNETEMSFEGTLEDTSELTNAAGEATPMETYFNTSPAWPVYKNYDGVEGGFDNPYFEVIQ